MTFTALALWTTIHSVWVNSKDFVKDFIIPIMAAGLGAGIGAAVTLRVFKRQSEENQRARIAEFESKVNEENLRLDRLADRSLLHFSWLLDGAIDYIKKQNDNFLTTSNAITANKLIRHPLGIIASSTMGRILSLEQSDVFFSLIRKALDTENNRNRIKQVYAQLDYIDSTIKRAREVYEEHILGYHSQATIYRDYIEEVRELVADVGFVARGNILLQMDPFTLVLRKVQVDFLAALETNPAATDFDWQHLNYLRPLLTALVKDFIDDPRAKPIMTVARRASILMGRIEFSSTEAAKYLEATHAEIAEALGKLQAENNYITLVNISTQKMA